MTAARRDKFFADVVRSLKGKRCWYVSSGAVGTTFQLALGRRVLRGRPLRNESHPEAYRTHEGESNLLVWCSWRLDRGAVVLTSSNDSDENVVRELDRLVGRRIVSVAVVHPAWDLSLRFGDALSLQIFCDHVPTRFNGNWDLATEGEMLSTGPGAYFERKPRRDSPPTDTGGSQW